MALTGRSAAAAFARRFASIAVDAGVRIMEVYAAADPGVARKADGSPVTVADLAAEAVIAAGLATACPTIPVVSEEGSGAEAALPLSDGRFVLVDPLDGTREFLGRTGEFTVNIALVQAGVPVCGVVYAPVLGRLWLGVVGEGAEAGLVGADGSVDWCAIRARPVPAAAMVAVASRSHRDAATEAFLGHLPIAEHRAIGSSLKFCLVAEGAADVYPRFGPTMEWDTAAGHAVLAAAGGRVEAPGGGDFRYGKQPEGWRNGPFVAWGGSA